MMSSSNNTPKGESKVDKSKIEKFSLEKNFFVIDKQRADKAAEDAERTRKIAEEAEKVTDEALAKVKDEGFQQGFNSGVNQTTETLKQETTEFIGGLAQSFETLEKTKQELSIIFEKKSLELVKELLLKTIHHACEHYSDEILTATLSNALKQVSSEANLFVKLHPESKTYIEEHGGETFGKYKATLIADSTITKGEATIEWDSSGLDVRLKHIINGIDEVIEASISGVSIENTHYTLPIDEEATVEENPAAEAIAAEEIAKEEHLEQPITEQPTAEEEPTEVIANSEIEIASEVEETLEVSPPKNDIQPPAEPTAAQTPPKSDIQPPAEPAAHTPKIRRPIDPSE